MRLALIAGIVIGLLAVVSSNSENSNEELRKRNLNTWMGKLGRPKPLQALGFSQKKV